MRHDFRWLYSASRLVHQYLAYGEATVLQSAATEPVAAIEPAGKDSLAQHYNLWLVALSVAVAILASYTTLDVALRVRESSGRSLRAWLIGGSLTLGLGIWSMHFIGMLAHTLHIPIGYDVSLTLLSILPAVGATALALRMIYRRASSRLALIGGGIIIGTGICAMHYIGMAALQISPAIQYRPSLYILSWLIAVGAATNALTVGLRIRANDPWLLSKKLIAAAFLGLAIAGMHYTGMAAADFVPGSVSLAFGRGLDEQNLAVAVGLGSFMVLTIALLIAAFDARLASEHAAARARLEVEVEARTAELRQAVRVRDEFLAIASHELRTPVAALKLQAQMMKRKVSRSEQPVVEREFVEKFAVQVERGVSSIALLVERMLDIANIDRGQLRLAKERTDLAALTKEVLDQLGPLLPQALHQDIRGPVIGHWDPQRLEQVVANLLMNVARHARGCPASITVLAEEDKARLVVEDQGPGIAQEQQELIFQRFARGGATSDGTGMGLGLAVTDELVRAHGGAIRVESEIGKGTRFIVELPLTAAAEQPVTAAS